MALSHAPAPCPIFFHFAVLLPHVDAGNPLLSGFTLPALHLHLFDDIAGCTLSFLVFRYTPEMPQLLIRHKRKQSQSDAKEAKTVAARGKILAQ
jgi:hypothetical protein